MAAKKSTEGVQPRLWTTKQVAAYLGVAEGTARMWALMPIDPLPSFNLPHLKTRRFDRADVDQWIDRRKSECA